MLGKNEIREILKSRFANDRHTKISEIPLPCDLKDTYKAALRIKTAIEENQRIAVVGDYDVDGIVSTVIMSDFFSLLSGPAFFTRLSRTAFAELLNSSRAAFPLPVPFIFSKT